MYTIGIDIGTTTIACLAVDVADGTVLAAETAANDAALSSCASDEAVQDPERIVALVFSCVARLKERVSGQLASRPEDRLAELQAEQFEGRLAERQSERSEGRTCVGVGLSGQMHGIVYLNKQGLHTSPLFSWQDRRGAPFLNLIYKKTAHRVHAGYGWVTHIANVRRGLVPEGSVALSTIGDYVAMRLAGAAAPAMNATQAASLGGFMLEQGQFDSAAWRALSQELLHELSQEQELSMGQKQEQQQEQKQEREQQQEQKLKLSPEQEPGRTHEPNRAALRSVGASFLPPPRVVAADSVVGHDASGAPVFSCIGDNQASFLGSVTSLDGSLLVNVGTGAQMSAYTSVFCEAAGLELRPFPDGGYLFVGASLSGGKSYALLAELFAETLRLFGAAPGLDQVYDTMNRLACLPLSTPPPTVHTQFYGTRDGDGSSAGVVEGITNANWTPAHLVHGFLDGMADELTGFYVKLPEVVRGRLRQWNMAGNGIRRNESLQERVGRRLGLPLQPTPGGDLEEAAYGAALHAAVSAGRFPNYASAIRRWRGGTGDSGQY